MKSKAQDGAYIEAHWKELLTVWDHTLEGFQEFYNSRCGEKDGKYEAVDSGGKELLQLSGEDLEKAASLLDDFETEQAVLLLKEWIGSPLEREMHERIKGVLIALEDEFDEDKAIRLLRE